jgi:hypothetical protein
MRRSPLLLALLALAAAAAPARADETVATIDQISPLRAYGDIVVWSTSVPGGYQLTMRRGAAAPAPIPIAPRDRAGGFDIGTDAAGNPLLVYTRCDHSCDIYTATLDGRERRIAAASAPKENESHPAVSGGRLSWVRGLRVYTRKLSDPKRVPSRRLYAMGRRICYGPSECQRISARSLDELDISGSRVALLGSYEIADGHAGYIVRSIDARTGKVRRISDIGTGESGQFVFGLDFHAGQLGLAESCRDDPEGCRAGAFRYRPGHAKEHTASVSQAVGFTLAGPGQAYVLQGTVNDGSEGDFLCPCRVEQRSVRWVGR